MQTPTRAGWFDDPEDDQQLRYFDGVVWTKHTTPRSTRPASAVPAQPGQQQYPGQGHPPQYPGQTQGGSGEQSRGEQGQGGQQAQAGSQGQGGQPSGQSPAGWQAPNPQFPGTPQSGQWNAPPQGQYGAPQYPGQQGQYPGQQAPWNAPGYGAFSVGPTTPDGQPLASYGRRVAAFLIDWVIQSMVAAALGYVFLSRAFSDYFAEVDRFTREAQNGKQPDLTALSNSIDIGSLVAYSLVAILVFAIYQVLFLSRLGATPGKLLLGISVRQRSQPGPLPLPVVLRRVGFAAVLFVLQPVPVLGFIALIVRMLDLAWPAWDDKRQALHDRVAGTNVVKGKQQRP